MALIVQTDPENDTCYIALGREGLAAGAVAKTIRVNEDLALDFDSAGQLIGLDVMNASRTLPAGFDEPRGADALVGVKEAASMAGMQRSNFVRDIASRNDFPEPIAELATGRIWLRSEVESYLAARPRKKPAARKKRTA